MKLANRIKERREALEMSRVSFAQALNISVGAVSNYENGFSMPRPEILCEMFAVLQCDANYLYQDVLPESSAIVSMEEEEILTCFRSLPSNSKHFIKEVLKHEMSKQQSEHAKEFIMLAPPKLIDHYPALASAGTGQFLFDDIPTLKMEIDPESLADFAIDVNGNSMEPTFTDGDTLLVKKQDTLYIGEIGIFLVDGESYVKEYQKDRLVSHNKKYPDILFKGYQDIRCLGKVINSLYSNSKTV